MSRQTFDSFYNKVAMGAMTLVCVYAASQLKELSDSVSQLNVNVAVLVSRVTVSERVQEQQSTKIDELSRRVSSIEKE